MNEFEYYPLTHPQMSIWYTEKMFPNTSISNVAGTARIKGIVDFDLLEKAINLFIEKNDSFRIRITNKNGEEKQYINTYQYRKIDFLDFSKYEDPDIQMYKWNEEQTSTPFNLYDSDLSYFAMIKINDEESAFYAKIHHIISDAWTMSLLVNEILAFYSALKRGEDILEEKYPSYIEFINSEIEYKNSDRFIKDQQYWLNKFASLPEATVLKTQTTNEKNTTSKRKTIITPAKFTNKLREYCKENSTSPYPLFLAALAMYINRVTEKEDIVIGTPILNRSNRKEKNITGMFINTLPLRLIIDSNTNFKTFSKYVSVESMSLLRHQKYPYDLLLKNIRSKYNYSENLYDIVLSYQNSKMEKHVIDEQYTSRWHFNHHQVNSLTIHINDRDDDGRLIIDYDYHEDLYSGKEIDFLHTHMLSLLWHALDNHEKNINKIEMLPESEKNKILYEFNNTRADYPKDKNIHQLFEEQVERTPDSIALIFEDKTMTYRELNQKANQLAYALRRKGLKKQDIVGIMIKRSFEMIIGILAVLKSGCAYIPIDPKFPKSRIEYMLEDSNSKFLLTQKDLLDKKGNKENCLDLFDKTLYNGLNSNLNITCHEEDLAYIIYTSGSSGKPKGVKLTHRGLRNFVYSMKNLLELTYDKTIVSITTISFDIFIFETLLPLTQGLKIIIANEDESKIPILLYNLLTKYGVNIIQATPSIMNFIIDNLKDYSCFKLVTDIIIGGEKFPYSLLEKLRTVTKAKIYNGYGPSETTIYSTFKDLTNERKINIGRPISNTTIYILDNNMNLVPIGIYGEMYIGGDGVGNGYINNTKLSNEKFISNPFSPKELIYKTGDIARWFPAGEIDFYGRKDQQVKIRGLRIELEEIENELLNIEYIEKVVVIVRQNETKDNYLCAFYSSEQELPVEDIRNKLLAKLPDYMVPSFFCKLETFPLTPNGKIDKKRLPQIQVKEIVKDNYVPPRNNIDSFLVDEWEKVLNISNVGIDSNFFELGGDSLKAIQLQVNLLRYNWNLETQDIYRYNTIRKLSDRIEILINNSSLQQVNKEITLSGNKDKQIIEDLRIERASYRNILLTGSTGFLGIHILDYLLDYTDSVVYCIVRGNSLDHAKYRLKNTLYNYFSDKHTEKIDKRIYILNGDITEKNFGLSSNKYKQISENVNAVIHTAALVKYYGEYSEFNRVNVIGTQNIAEFSAINSTPLFYISTMGLSGQHTKCIIDPNSVFSEFDIYPEDVYENDFYIKSKYSAEKLINQYINSGNKATIFRVGNLTGRYSDGHFQINIEDNYFYNTLKSIISIGAVSDNVLDIEFNLTPVDLCSKAIVEVLLTENCLRKVFHIYNNNIINIHNLLILLNLDNIYIRPLKKNDFNELIKKLSIEHNENLNRIVNNLNNEYQLDFGKNVIINSNFSINYLDKLDFHWPVINEVYIKKLIKFMKKVKFID